MRFRLAVMLTAFLAWPGAAAWAHGECEPAGGLVDPEAGGWYFVDESLWFWLAGSSVIPVDDEWVEAIPAAEPAATFADFAQEVIAVSLQEEIEPAPAEEKPKVSEWSRILARCSKCAFYFADPIQGGWYFAADAVWLQRSEGDPIFLGNSVDTAGATTGVLTSNDDSMSDQIGPGFTLGYRLHYGDEIELTYVGLQHWTTGRTLQGDPVGGQTLLTSPFLTIDNLLSGFDGGLAYVLSSEFHDAQLTYRHVFPAPDAHWQPRIEGGIRYINLDEDMALTGVNSFIFPAEETLYVQTSNHLLGAQLGGSLRWLPFESLTVDVGGKGGLYMNFAHQDMNRQLAANGVVAENLSGSADDVVFAAGVDAGVMLRYAVKPDVILRAGYQVLYLSGLALAPEQLESNIGPGLSATNLNDTGTAAFHGPSVGLELYWGGR